MALTIKQHRVLKDLTIGDMADRCGVTRQTYTKWEKDSGKISFEMGKKIADALGVPMDDIIFLPSESTFC